MASAAQNMGYPNAGGMEGFPGAAGYDAHHAHHHKKGLLSGSSLSKAFWFATKATALYFGFFALDAFMDFGLIHSEGWAGSPLANLSHEFLSPISDKLPSFFESEFGEMTLNVLTTVLHGIHNILGIEGTFEVASLIGEAALGGGGYSGSNLGLSEMVDSSEVFYDSGEAVGGSGSDDDVSADDLLDALENF